MTEKWEDWEQEVQRRLGLSATVCSGNKWNDVGDATDNSNPHDSSFRPLIDCKYTSKLTFGLHSKILEKWVVTAEEAGKRAMLAIRFGPSSVSGSVNWQNHDYVVMTMEDFEELMALVREHEDLLREVTRGV